MRQSSGPGFCPQRVKTLTVRDEFRRRSGEPASTRYWLACAKPKVAGHFALQYSFKPQNRRYSHLEHEIVFSVGPQGCHRGPTSPNLYGRFCLGDTVIIPVGLEAATDLEFKLTRTSPRPDEDEKAFDKKYPDVRDQGLDQTPVANPSEHLRYVGRRPPQNARAKCRLCG
jgi:hypothetical protein